MAAERRLGARVIRSWWAQRVLDLDLVGGGTAERVVEMGMEAGAYIEA